MTTLNIAVPLHPTPHQAQQLEHIARLVRDARELCRLQVGGVDATLAEIAGGPPAASRAPEDEVAALADLPAFADVPYVVLDHTVRGSRSAFRRAARGRPLAPWYTDDAARISAKDWHGIWTPRLITLEGVDDLLLADLDSPEVPPVALAAWKRERGDWQQWALELAPDPPRRVDQYLWERTVFEHLNGALGPLEELISGWWPREQACLAEFWHPTSWSCVTRTAGGWVFQVDLERYDPFEHGRGCC